MHGHTQRMQVEKIEPRPASLSSLCSPQTRQPVFVQLLQAVFRVYHCNWLIPVQKGSVESCIKVLSDVGKIHIAHLGRFQAIFPYLGHFHPFFFF